MNRTVIPDHIIGWLEKIKKNLINFKKIKSNMTIDEQIYYLRKQYMLLEIIISVNDGEMYFHGIRQDNIDKG